mgnify:CR=1 FL=1
MTIDADSIDVVAPAVTGNMYAMQTILQMYKLDTAGFPVGHDARLSALRSARLHVGRGA